MTHTSSPIFVVYNPVAGRTDPDSFRTLLAERCATSDRPYELYETRADDDVEAMIHTAISRGYRCFAAAGGDGTVAAVASGLVGSEAVLAILPVGTANVLATELHIPADIAQAINLLLTAPETRRIDAMRMAGRHFFLHIGVGITSLMHRDTGREQKRRFGRLAYIATATRWLLDFQPTRFMIVADGERHRRNASQVMIANGGALGGAFLRWDEDIDPADGRIDICVLHARTLRDYVTFGFSALIGRQRSLGRMRVFTATQKISLNTRQSLPVQADGEIVGTTPVQIEVVPSAVRVIVPTI